jgi:hypothetical protein
LETEETPKNTVVKIHEDEYVPKPYNGWSYTSLDPRPLPNKAPKVVMELYPPIAPVTPPLAKTGWSGGRSETTFPDFDDIMNSPTPVRKNSGTIEETGTMWRGLNSRPSSSAVKPKFVSLFLCSMVFEAN